MASLRVGRPSILSRALPSCLAPAQRPRLASWIVLDDLVPMRQPPDWMQEDWALVLSGKRTAYGCGVHGQKILDGLTIYVRLIKSGHVTSALYIRMSDLARDGVLAEFGNSVTLIKINGITTPLVEINPKDLSADAVLKTVGEELMVFAVGFHLRRQQHLFYYMVYDALDRSLAMIPGPPEHSSCGLAPLTVRRIRGDGTSLYKLVVMAKEREPLQLGQECCSSFKPVLYVWTPEPSVPSKDGPCQSESQWCRHEVHFDKEVGEEFFVKARFIFQGRVVSVDLAKGLVHGCLQDRDSDVNFSFVPLPKDVQCDRWVSNRPEDTVNLNLDRTMKCIQGSIRFVCIDRSSGQHANVKLTMWTLNLITTQWTKDRVISTMALWKLDPGMPQTAPKCPILMQDGSLSVLLPNLRKKKEDSVDDYVCNLDGRNLTFNWSARLDGYTYSEPFIMSPGFFSKIIHPSDGMSMADIFVDR